jgi:transcriptional regulator with XRE-family HTH domain
MRAALGARVRELRTEQGETTRSLAAAVGVTSGFISQVENGQTTPSLATLLRLAAKLGVGMGELFDALPTPGDGRILRRSERTTIEPAPGLRDQVLTLDPSRRLEVVQSELAPGAETNHEPHTHGAEVEFVLVLSGELEVELDGTRYRLDAGDAVTFPGDTLHRFANPGSETARIVWASSPASF